MFITLAISCDRPNCKTDNIIFKDFNPEDIEYKNELLKQIENSNKDEIRFWLKKIDQNNIEFYIQDDNNLCACLSGKIKEKSKLSKIVEDGGKGYIGSEFIGLGYHTIKEENDLIFIIENYSLISD